MKQMFNEYLTYVSAKARLQKLNARFGGPSGAKRKLERIIRKYEAAYQHAEHSEAAHE